MKVVIMAGGRGTRIAPVQDHVPKPMIPIAKRPVIEYGIRCLARQGYTDITLVVGYLGRIIQDYFGDGSKFGVSLTYFVEKEPLGTAGALFRMYAAGMIQEDFFLINGDIMLDIDFRRMEEYHSEKRADTGRFSPIRTVIRRTVHSFSQIVKNALSDG